MCVSYEGLGHDAITGMTIKAYIYAAPVLLLINAMIFLGNILQAY